MKLVTAARMRDLEQQTEALGLPSPALMENAGRAVADALARICPPSGRRVLVLVGPGNNGGDGLVAARHLHDAGARVTCYLVRRPPTDDVKLRLLTARRVRLLRAEDDSDYRLLDLLLDQSDLVLDSLLGTGRSRPIRGELQAVLERVNVRTRVDGVDGRLPWLVALDLPTGLDADTGQVDPSTPRADVTITLGRPKRGLFLPPGAEFAGRIVVVDIGLAPDLDASPTVFPEELVTAEAVRAMLPRRPILGHKGSFGKVLVVAGSARYTGAPALAAMGVYRVGAGLVALATPTGAATVIQCKVSEPTFLPLPETPEGTVAPPAVERLGMVAKGYDVLLLGPGLGRSAATAQFLRAFLDQRATFAHLRWVIDADGLNLLAEIPEFWQQLPERCILTPHPGEMARLIQSETMPADRLALAAGAAARWRQVVVLKGAYTVIAAPGELTRVNPFANPALATAGTGDVLAGAIAGLLAQGLAPSDAAVAGVYLHALAGELLRQRVGPVGGVAGELLSLLPEAIRRLRRGDEPMLQYQE